MMRLKNIFSGITASVCLLAAAVGILVLLARAVWSGADTRVSISSQINDRIRERAIGQSSATLFSSRNRDMDRIRNLLINRSRPVGLIENLEQAATTNGVAVTFGLSEASSGPHDLLFQLTIAGSQANVLRYLELLEVAPYLMHMEEITFEKAAPDNAGRVNAFGPPGSRYDAMARVSLRVETR